MQALDPDQFAEAVAKGVRNLQRGVTDFLKWSRLLIYQCGEAVRPHLVDVWAAAQDEWKQPTESLHAPPAAAGGSATGPSPQLPRLLRVAVGTLLVGAVSFWCLEWWNQQNPRSAPPELTDSAPTAPSVAADLRFLPGFDPGPPMKEPVSMAELTAGAFNQDPRAQFLLGLRYFNQSSSSDSASNAVACWQKAAMQGYVSAQADLAYCLALGLGADRDFAKAVEWASRAASGGSPAGMYLMADALMTPWPGCKADHATGFKSLRNSADRAYVPAQLRLAQCYLFGGPVQTNANEAVGWLTRAAVQGSLTAQAALAKCYHDGVGVAPDPAEAAHWWLRAARQGDASAQYEIGVCYEEGKGLPKDPAEAAKWFRLAAAQKVEHTTAAVPTPLTARPAESAVAEADSVEVVRPRATIVDSSGTVTEHVYTPRRADEPAYDVKGFEQVQRDYAAKEVAFQESLERLRQQQIADERARRQAEEKARIHAEEMELRKRAVAAAESQARAVYANTRALNFNTMALRDAASELESWRFRRLLWR